MVAPSRRDGVPSARSVFLGGPEYSVYGWQCDRCVWVAQGGGRDLLGEPTVERMTATDWGWTCDRLIGSATACLLCHGLVAQMG